MENKPSPCNFSQVTLPREYVFKVVGQGPPDSDKAQRREFIPPQYGL